MGLFCTPHGHGGTCRPHVSWYYFEIVIWFFLIAVGAFLVEVGVMWKHGKARKSIRVVAIFLSLAWLVIFYGSFIEPRMLVVKSYTLALSDSSTHELRVAVLSDLHLGPYKNEAWTKKVVSQVNKQFPDVVFLLGDFISHDPHDAEGLTPLRDLKAPHGVFAVTGNHDYSSFSEDEIVDRLENLGVRVLRNESARMVVRDAEWVLVGTDDIWFEGNPYVAMKGVKEDEAVLFLSHNPDVVYSPDAGLADVVFAGHTHGGQIRLPWVGPIGSIPTALGRAFDEEILTFLGQKLFVTSGLGETGSRARLFNPPEISIVTVTI